ncbi:MAG: iron ABC transporter permease [Rhizobiales bacterium]|nr:iron ABC transporter permease [Hyphomicrobiales bacterium]OJY46991.1 MAG: iron ABC transporter [Rhizobiales bacterium 64-17]
MTAPSTVGRRSRRRLRPSTIIVLSSLLLLLLVAVIVSAAIGAAGIPPTRLLALVGLTSLDPATFARDHLVLWSIRLPRIALAAMIGALLAVSGAMMQGLFRNPLADPAMVGVSSGAAFAAALTIVIVDRFATAGGPLSLGALSLGLLPVTALIGALITTAALYRLATRHGRTSIAVFLLGGLAIAALTNAGIGFLVFMADDRQLRDITFWMLGSLAGATWQKVAIVAPFLVLTAAGMPLIARGLDLLALGEAEAFHMGIAVERLKQIAILLVAIAVGAAVAFCGVVGFVGIVVPHLLRLAIGPSHRLLLPASMLLGAAMMLAADSVARTIAAPAELPIGIVTAIVGAPFFLALLLRQRNLVSA